MVAVFRGLASFLVASAAASRDGRTCAVVAGKKRGRATPVEGRMCRQSSAPDATNADSNSRAGAGAPADWPGRTVHLSRRTFGISITRSMIGSRMGSSTAGVLNSVSPP